MYNLIKMNLYRMIHSNSMWIILLITLIFTFFNMYMINSEAETSDHQSQEVNDVSDNKINIISSSEVDDDSFGISIKGVSHEDGSQPALLEYLCSDLRSGILLIFMGIFSVLFVNAEDKSGYIKNIAGQTTSNWAIYLSKVVCIVIYAFFTIVLYGIAQLTIGFILYEGAPFGMDMLGDTLMYVLIQWLLMCAFGSGLALVTVISKSTSLGIALGILSACGFSSIISGVVNKLLKISDFNLGDYFVVSNINKIMFNSSSGTLTHALIIAAAFLIVYNILGSIWVEKRDII